MRLYSQENASHIPWPDTDEGQRLKHMLVPMLIQGTKSFVSNVHSKIYILHVDDLFLPITINHKEYKNSYVCSLYSFLLYADEEMVRHKKTILRFFMTPFLCIIKAWFRVSLVNKLVIINNFLFSTNLYPAISPSGIPKITNFLKTKFPDHALIFRSLNDYTEKNLCDSLKISGFELITTRSVYFFDPTLVSCLTNKKRWIILKDKKLLNQSDIKIISHEDFVLSDAKDIKRLYDLLYLEKYSYYNPAFTEDFFKNALTNKTILFSGIKYKNTLVGVIGYFSFKNIMATPIVGYDTSLGEKLGLYRMLTAIVLEESRHKNLLFHMSAGVGHFKRQRGGFQIIESMAVYYRHLPWYRKAFWFVLKSLFNYVAKPILKKNKL